MSAGASLPAVAAEEGRPRWQQTGEQCLERRVLASDLSRREKGDELTGNDIQGDITFVAKGKITISGRDSMFEAYWTDPVEGIDILFFSEEGSAPKAVDVSGSGGAWSGALVEGIAICPLRPQQRRARRLAPTLVPETRPGT